MAISNEIINDTTEDIKTRLLDDLYSYLNSNPTINIRIDKDDEYYESGIHCSSLGYCKRKAVYQYFNFPAKPLNLQTLLVFARGNFYHELVYKWMGQSKEFKLIHKEFKVSDGLPKEIRGKFDLCFKDLKTGLKILTDIKTANSNQFKKYSNFLPKKEHIIQLSSYGKGYKKMKFNFDLNLMMYFSTGADLPQFYFVEPCENINDIMADYMEAVNTYEDLGEPPARFDEVFDKNEIWQCSYCNYEQITCKEGDK
jgi:hypothetical protein